MMAIPYYDDGADFRADLKAAGFNSELFTKDDLNEIANALECSYQHTRNMLSGWNRYSKPMRAKMNKLIGDAFNSIEVAPIIGRNSISQFNEPVDLPNNKFAVIDATDGTAVIVEIIAPFRDHTMARKLCQKLNDEN